VTETLSRLLGLTLVIFMAGNLLEMGLKLNLRDAFGAVRNVRFLVMSVVWAFVLSPALAVLLTKIIPMPEPYALGLLFLGMAPCAPFLPAVAQKAGGDLAYAAAFMLLAALGTVIYMPLMVPVLVNGFTADALTIAEPLVFYITAPMAIGMLIRATARTLADAAHPIVKRATGIDTLIMVALILVLYSRDFLNMVGTYSIGAQILFCGALAVAPYGIGLGLPPAQKSVLALGLCTRNIGAAIAPLFAVAGTDRRAVVMCAMAVPVTVITALIAARVLGCRTAARAPGGAPISA
jgi:bile acid:Na+ symporter, BASS family